MKVVGVIPARYASSRFPGKPLALIAGRPLIRRVWERVSRCRELDDVVIATDDRRIAGAAEAFGARAVMTPVACRSGTDRLAAVARAEACDADAFVNIQGDEPLISPALVDRLARTLRTERDVNVVTAACRFRKGDDVSDPNAVKVVLDRAGRALYFSRSPLPYPRSGGHDRCLKHMGIYGYRRDFLLRFAAWPQTPLEKTEMLEQLRILENGFSVRVLISRTDSFGVDVPEDIARIERLLR